MPPKKGPKKPPCAPTDVQYKRGNKKFCRLKPKGRAKSRSPSPKPKSPEKKEKTPKSRSPKPKPKSPEKKKTPVVVKPITPIIMSLTQTPEWKQPSIQIPVAIPSRESCMQAYRAQSEVKLGQGNHGEIVAACKNADCKYVLKISNLQDPTSNPANDRLQSQKDVYFLNLLKNARVNGSRMVPTLYDHWTCTFDGMEHSFIVVDRWDSDMQALSIKNGLKARAPGKLYTKNELLRMFRIGYALGALGVVHGDLKPNQYLQRNNGNEIVITDFGFAGGAATPYVAEMGWSGHDRNDPQPYDCGVYFRKLKYDMQKQKTFPIYLNLVQLEIALVQFGPVYIQTVGNQFIPFGGISDFNRREYPTYCSAWSEAYAPLQRDLHRENAFYFTMAEVMNIA
jgi:hypothetical protein